MQTFSRADVRRLLSRFWFIPVLIVVAAIIALVLGQSPGGPGTPDQAPATGRQKSGYENRALWGRGPGAGQSRTPSIQGTAYELDGRPLAGVRVVATTFVVAGNRSAAAGSAETDPQGRFALQLADGSYYLTADKEGYGSSLVIAHSGDDIGLVLEKSGAIVGRVTDENKQPITRFSIDVITPLSDDMAAPAPLASKSFESADGSFRLEQLPNRPVMLRATATDYAPTFSPMVRIEGTKTQTVDLTMERGCTMTGVVQDEQGQPLADVFVDAELRKSAGIIGTASVDATSHDDTDTDGRFELAHVPLGEVLVRAYDGDHAVSSATVPIESCEELTPITLRMAAGGTLSGSVRDSAGNPVAGAKLTLTSRALGFVNTVTDDKGEYRFERLPAGAMRIEAKRGDERAVALVTLEEGKSARRDLPFSSGGKGEIHGRVTAGGQPLSGMQLLVAAHGGKGILGMRYPVTGADGTYRVTGLPDGTYAVIVSSLNKVSSAHIEAGASETVDFDVASKPQRPRIEDILREAEQNQDEEEE